MARFAVIRSTAGVNEVVNIDNILCLLLADVDEVPDETDPRPVTIIAFHQPITTAGRGGQAQFQLDVYGTPESVLAELQEKCRKI